MTVTAVWVRTYTPPIPGPGNHPNSSPHGRTFLWHCNTCDQTSNFTFGSADEAVMYGDRHQCRPAVAVAPSSATPLRVELGASPLAGQNRSTPARTTPAAP